MLDPILLTLASEVGKMLAQAMVTDGWTAIRDRFTPIAERGEQPQAIATIDTTRANVLAGRVALSKARETCQLQAEAIIREHPELSKELRALLDDARAVAPTPTIVNQSASNVRGNSTQVGRDYNKTDNSRKTLRFDSPVVLIAMLVAALFGGILVVNVVVPAVQGLSGPGITADTLCRDYIPLPTEERSQAANSVALEMGSSAAGSPFLLPNLDDQCSRRHDSTIGSIIEGMDF